MLIPIDWLVPNPYRDFERYPYDEKQIQKLLESIDGLSFWGGVTARPDPSGNKQRFEIGGGHHRVEAYRRAMAKNFGLDHQIDVCVDEYTDLQMAQIQAIENLTQGGNQAAPALDAIGGLYEVLSYAVLSGVGLCGIPQSLADNEHALEQTKRALIRGDGLGAPTFLDALPKGCMSLDTIKVALRALKDGGLDEPILARVHARIERENAEREAEERHKTKEAEAARLKAEQEAREAEERRKARDAEQKRKSEERQHREEERRKEAEEKKAKLVEENERKAAERAERERRVEEEHQRKEESARERAETARLRAEENAKKKVEQDAKTEQERQRKTLEREVKSREDAEKAYKAAQAREKTLDPRVSSQLGWTNYQIRQWNAAVSTEAARNYLNRSVHFELAQAISQKGAQLAQENPNFEMTAKWIADQVQIAVERAIGIQRDVNLVEKTKALKESASNRVREEYRRMRKACRDLRDAGLKLRDLQQEYTDKNLGVFPYDGDTFDLLREARDALNTILNKEQTGCPDTGMLTLISHESSPEISQEASKRMAG